MPFTTSIIPASAGLGSEVKNPASPSMDFSISALQGQTVTQWPQETQLDSPMGAPPSHNTRGWAILPVDAERFIHLHVLTGFDATSAKDALTGIIAIEGIGHIYCIRLGLEGNVLMLESSRAVVLCTVQLPLLLSQTVQ